MSGRRGEGAPLGAQRPAPGHQSFKRVGFFRRPAVIGTIMSRPHSRQAQPLPARLIGYTILLTATTTFNCDRHVEKPWTRTHLQEQPRTTIWIVSDTLYNSISAVARIPRKDMVSHGDYEPTGLH